MWITERFRVQIDAIQEAVCAVCVDGVFNDRKEFVRCGLPQGCTCAVREHLPEVIDVVRRIGSASLEEHVRAVREHVCAYCDQQAADGHCPLRDALDCALDRHLALLVQEIEAMPR